MTIISAAQSNALAPTHSQTPVGAGVAKADMPPDILTTWQQMNDRSATDTEARAHFMKTLAKKDPHAFALYLGELASQHQRQITNVRTHTVSLMSNPQLGTEQIDVVDQFEKTMIGENDTTVRTNQNTIGKYTGFMEDLTALMRQINQAVTADKDSKDGKSKLNGKTILKLIEDFCKKYAGDKKTIASFKTQEEANKFNERFRGQTTEVHLNTKTNQWEVNFSMKPVGAVFDVIASNSDNSNIMKKALADGGTDITNQSDRLRDDEINTSVNQALTLATSDVQKSYQTDLDLQLNELSRSLSQFDNLVKLFSSMMSALTDSYKSFL